MTRAESNAKGKLPIHPSYLELKRILVEHADFRSSDAKVAAAKALIQTPEPQASPSTAEVQDQHADVATATIAGEPPQNATTPTPVSMQVKAKLPPMRKAAN